MTRRNTRFRIELRKTKVYRLSIDARDREEAEKLAVENYSEAHIAGITPVEVVDVVEEGDSIILAKDQEL